MVNDSTFLAVSTGVACVAAATVYWAFTRHSRAPSPSPTHARSHGMSPSGVMAIGGEEEMDFGRLQLVDVATGEVLHDLDGHENIVVSVALSPSGRFLASGSYDSSWRLWDAVTGEELLVVWGHSDFGGPCICDIRRWDYNIPFAVVKKNCTAEGHSGGVTSLAFSSCGKWLASGGGSGSLLVWDAGAGTAAVHLIGEQMKRLTSGAIADCDGVMSLAFTADTAFLASAGGRGGVGVWDWRAGTQVHSFDAEAGDIEVSLSPDSRTLVVSGNGGVQFWDIRSGDLVNESEDDGALLSPDGLTLATFGDYGGTIVLRDAATLEPRELEHELWVSRDGSRLFKMAFHPDGGLFAAVPFLDRCQYNTICIVWDMQTGERICCYPAEPEENEDGEVVYEEEDEFTKVHHVWALALGRDWSAVAERRLAFAMGGHERLGGGSLVGGMDAEVLAVLLQLVC